MATTNKEYISPNLKIEIRPIPNRKGIREFSEDLEYFSQAHTISPLVNPDTRKYVTGLTDEDIKYLKSQKFPYDLSDVYVEGTANPFWESSLLKVSLINSSFFLYPGQNPIDFVKYKYLLKSKYVYSSEKEMLEGDKVNASHFMYNAETEINIKATKINEKNKLAKSIADLSLTKKREIVLIILNENTDNKNEDYLLVRFEDILQNEEHKSQLISLLEYSQEDIALKAIVKNAIQKNIFRRTKTGIYYFDNNLGYTEEEVATSLNLPDNQDLLLKIKEKI